VVPSCGLVYLRLQFWLPPVEQRRRQGSLYRTARVLRSSNTQRIIDPSAPVMLSILRHNAWSGSTMETQGM
jgi:hypothetical protein